MAKTKNPTGKPPFGSGTLKFPTPKLQNRYAQIMMKPMKPVLYMDLHLVPDAYRARVNNLLRLPEWRFLFTAFREQVYPDVVHEFLTTFKGPKDVPQNTASPAFTFTIAGDSHTLSCDRLNKILGFDDLQEVANAADYRRLVTKVPDEDQWWQDHLKPEFRDKPWVVGCSKISNIADPVLRIVHYMLSHQVNARQESTGHVTGSDIVALYCIETGERCHMGSLVAQFLRSQSLLRTKTVFCGPFVTAILRGLDLLGSATRGRASNPALAMIPLEEVNLARILDDIRRARGRRNPRVVAGAMDEDVQPIRIAEPLPALITDGGMRAHGSCTPRVAIAAEAAAMDEDETLAQNATTPLLTPTQNATPQPTQSQYDAILDMLYSIRGTQKDLYSIVTELDANIGMIMHHLFGSSRASPSSTPTYYRYHPPYPPSPYPYPPPPHSPSPQ